MMANAHNITAPTLLILGGESNTCPDEDVAQVKAAVANCQAVRIAGAGHGVHGAKPAEFIAALQEFLR